MSASLRRILSTRVAHAPSRWFCNAAGRDIQGSACGGALLRGGACIAGRLHRVRNQAQCGGDLGVVKGRREGGFDSQHELEQGAGRELHLLAVELRRDPGKAAVGPLFWNLNRPTLRVLGRDEPLSLLAAQCTNHRQPRPLERVDWQGNRYGFRRSLCIWRSLRMGSPASAIAWCRVR